MCKNQSGAFPFPGKPGGGKGGIELELEFPVNEYSNDTKGPKGPKGPRV